MIRRTTLFISLLFLIPQTKETVIEAIRTWKTYPVPDKKIAYSYNSSMSDWTVFQKNGEIYAINSREFPPVELPFKIHPKKEDEYKLGGKISSKPVDDGYLVGFYRGEWGGNLWWFSKDGKNRYEISNDIIVSFFERDNKIFAIQGLAHLSMSDGSIIEIKKEKDKWIRETYLMLPEAPEGADVYKDFIIIITSNNLIKIDKQKKIDYLITDGFWTSYLYPTSLIVKDNIAYIGMRKGVLKYNLLTNGQDWLMRGK